MRELALFAGAGGGILGGNLLGWRTVAAVEIEEYPRAVLLRRQLDGFLPRFPIWDDIKTFNGKPWRGRIDIISGGFPCQDISIAGKGAGIKGERSGLWKEMFRIICEVRPKFVFVENSSMLTHRGLGDVLGDLAKVGYDAEWIVLGADDVGAPHRRKRIWILAYSCGERLQRGKQQRAHNPKWYRSEAYGSTAERRNIWWAQDPAEMADTRNNRIKQWVRQLRNNKQDVSRRCNQGIRTPEYESRERRKIEPQLGRVADGVAYRVDRLKAIGNGQVPTVAAVAFLELISRFERDL